jgi:hypothetical protein
MLTVSVLESRLWQSLLIVSVLGLSWLSMMAVHELGHVLNAALSGGTVTGVVLSPLEISRTDVAPNPHPQFVAWGGAVWGTVIPVVVLLAARKGFRRYTWLAAFVAGFCSIANGLYLAAGSMSGIGDAGDLLRHGAARWQLVAFGLPVAAVGLWFWNGLGPHFRFGVPGGNVDRKMAAAAGLAGIAFAAIESILAR